MKTYTNDLDELPDVKLYFLRKTIRRLPLGYFTKEKLYARLNGLLRWINLTFYNLPKKYPKDFSFIRSWTISRKMETIRKDQSVVIEGNLVTRTERELEVNPNRTSVNDHYRVKEEQRAEYPVTEEEKKNLYTLLKKTGFLHFEQENVEVSFFDHARIQYTLRANGIEYSFVDATECPLDEFWQPYATELNNYIDQLAHIEPVKATIDRNE